MTKQVCGECGRPMRLTPEARARKAAAARWGKELRAVEAIEKKLAKGGFGLGAARVAADAAEEVKRRERLARQVRAAEEITRGAQRQRAPHQAGCTCTLCALPA